MVLLMVTVATEMDTGMSVSLILVQSENSCRIDKCSVSTRILIKSGRSSLFFNVLG